MPGVLSVATAVPPFRYSQRQIKEAYADLIQQDGERASLSMLDHSGVTTRYLCFPTEYYLAGHPFERRNCDYVEQALNLSEKAIQRCLERGNASPDDISHIFLVTTTGLATPSLEAMLIERTHLPLDVQRTPIFGVGCAGGAVGLARVADYLRAYPHRLALLVSVELCGQNFDALDRSKLALVAVSLFGDGAAAALLAGDQRLARGPKCVGSQSLLFPNSLEIMGWKFTNQGMRLVLSPRLPALVKRTMPSVIGQFLATHGLSQDQISYWLFHPGSARVLDAQEQALALSAGKLQWARDFLAQYGNLSSASVLFILNQIMERGNPRPGEYGLVVAVGPGFSAELVLLKW